jgi:phage baseplate assembly protein W
MATSNTPTAPSPVVTSTSYSPAPTGVGFYNQPWYVIKTGNDLIYESMTRILLTNPGQRVMQPGFGVGIQQEVFALITPDVLQDLAVTIHSQLATYEPRIAVLDVITQLVSANILQISIVAQNTSDPTATETTVFNVSI